MGSPVKLIIDTDPGVDDAIALLLALAWPQLELMGVTTVGGNVPLARSTRNALAILDYAGRRDVPVARGAARPCQGRFGYSYSYHGKSGLSRRLPDPRIRAVDTSAADFLAEKLSNDPGGITVVALGPLTNLAHLLEQHPSALGQAASVVIMGGAVGGGGNVSPYAEFNFHSDPVAANLVVSSGVPLTLVDLHAGRRAFLTREAVQGARARSSIGRLALQLLNNWFRDGADRQRFEFYDPLAIAVALQPELVSSRSMALEVETLDPLRKGQVRVVSGAGPVSVVDQVDERSFFALLGDLFSLSQSSAAWPGSLAK